MITDSFPSDNYGVYWEDDPPEYEPDDGEAQRIAETYADAAGELARDEAGEA